MEKIYNLGQKILKEIYKMKKIISKKQNSGIVLVTTLLIMTLLTALAAFFIGSVLSEFKISASNRGGTIGFYVAESGVEEAIYKVKNDSNFRTNFLNGTLNSSNGSFSRNPYLIAGSSYSVVVTSIAPGEAQIISTGKYTSGGITAQRIVNTKIIKGVNPNPPWGNTMFGSDEVEISGSKVNIAGGDLFANEDIEIEAFSNVNATNNVYSNKDIKVGGNCVLTVGGEKRAQNYPPAPDPITMPQIDFDSSNPNSWLNQATAVYTDKQFSDLLTNNPNLTLSGIIYVKGSVSVGKGQSLTINGLLVADSDVEVGQNSSGMATLTVNKPANGNPSGVLTKGKIKIKKNASDVYINGLVYANDEFKASDTNSQLTIIGGIISRKVQFTNISTKTAQITYDNERVSQILNQENSASPTVQVEHWEENY